MNKKIFRSGFATSLLVLLISFGLAFGVLFDHFESQMFAELKSEAGYIVYALQNEGLSYLENFNENNKRITLVSADGAVLADTSADAESLENHADRKEIREALTDGRGTSTRHSDTLMQKTLYYAERLEDGTVLRVSTTQSSVFVILLGLLQPLLAIIFLALVLSWFLSRNLSKAIVNPINALDLEHPEENVTYEELTPLLKKLAAQQKTIRRQIREAERKQEEFKLITENMHEGLLVIDKDADVLSYNRAALQLLEITDFQEGSVLTFNRTKGFRNVVEQALHGQQAENEITVEQNTYRVIANPVLEQAAVIGAVIVLIDITEITKREQLRREFTSNVSHELKTPLTSISGFAEMMKEGGVPEETVTDFSASIYDEAQRLITLVNDIIKLSELEEGNLAFDMETVDLHALAQDVLRRLKPIADQKEIALNLIGDRVCVRGTRKILDEMLYNLCDNAIKYNRAKGTVDLLLTTDGQGATLTVRDTGIGIPQSEQSRVFERFYRVDKSHSKLVGGTGLGLAIVKHGAAYHDAAIHLQSAEGKGTAVTLTFHQ